MISNNIQALVLAAGKSTRIQGISSGMPKPLISIKGMSILERNLRWLAKNGFPSVWINLHYKPRDIIAAIGDGTSLGLSVQYSYEPSILGTAGALKNLQNQWKGSVLVLYGDNLVKLNLEVFIDAHRRNEAEFTIGVFDQDKHTNTGVAGGRVMIDDNNMVVGFVEGAGQDCKTSLVNAGIYLIEPSVLDLIPNNSFYDFGQDLLPAMVRCKRRLFSFVLGSDDYCLGMDTPESYMTGISLIESGRIELL